MTLSLISSSSCQNNNKLQTILKSGPVVSGTDVLPADPPWIRLAVPPRLIRLGLGAQGSTWRRVATKRPDRQQRLSFPNNVYSQCLFISSVLSAWVHSHPSDSSEQTQDPLCYPPVPMGPMSSTSSQQMMTWRLHPQVSHHSLLLNKSTGSPNMCTATTVFTFR